MSGDGTTAQTLPEPGNSVLFLSNGYGEDTIAASIVKRLLAASTPLHVLAMPLVGEGRAYARLGVEVVGPRKLMPSGGLVLTGWSNVWTDLRAGFWKMTRAQMSVLKRLRGRLGALVAVGDSYPVILGGLFNRQPVIMVGTAKSNYFYPYSFFERAIFRRYCDIVFARDEPTAETLSRHGIMAHCVGNAMMDSLGQTQNALPVPSDTTCVGLLPGSRAVAYRDLPVLLDAVFVLGAKRAAFFIMALPDTLDVWEMALIATQHGWKFIARDEEADDPSHEGVEGALVGFGQTILLVRGRFGDVVKHSNVIVGQAGTGNEQAVGMGRPVISFDSDGRNPPGWYRARQKGLLGDSMAIVERSGEAIATEARKILDDPQRYQYMQNTGYARMGPPGASDKIAAYIIEHVQRRCLAAPSFASVR